jgi:hypothetical protein
MRGHGAGAGIGEQVDQDIIRRQEKKVVVGGLEALLTLGSGCPADGLDALDSKGLDYGTGHGFFLTHSQLAAGLQLSAGISL